MEGPLANWSLTSAGFLPRSFPHSPSAVSPVILLTTWEISLAAIEMTFYSLLSFYVFVPFLPNRTFGKISYYLEWAFKMAVGRLFNILLKWCPGALGLPVLEDWLSVYSNCRLLFDMAA